LPAPIRAVADKNYALLRGNPRHPSLHFKRIGLFWSARVGFGSRAVAIQDDNDFVWFWIGKHDEYDGFIRG
jgi:hypothetical protein